MSQTDISKPRDITSLYNLFETTRTYDKDTIIMILKKWIDKNQNIKSNLDIPKSIEFGDVILFDISGQNHPCVVFKKEDDGTCHVIVLSTKSHEHHFIAKVEKSRIFSRSNFTSTVVSMPEIQALNNFIAVFDSPKELKAAVRLIKAKYKKIL